MFELVWGLIVVAFLSNYLALSLAKIKFNLN